MPLPNPWTSLLQAILIVVLGWIGRMILLVLREVRTINGRITRLEEWRDGVKERHHDIDARLARMEDRQEWRR